MIKKEYEKLLKNIQKPGRYVGGEYGEVIKDKSAVDVRFAFAFPDMYEIGMSNLGMKILYGIINNLDYAWCERVFAPDKDFADELTANGLDLYALESGDALLEFDFLGFTLSYELSYSNILYILSLANIPALACERDDNMPLIIGGGMCSYNPEPLAEFFDLFVIGEGEDVIVELMELYREHKSKGLYKRDFLLDCAKKIEGIYVPSLYEPKYGDNGKLISFMPKSADIPIVIKKRIATELCDAIHPIVPNIECVHDRITLEIFRGCMRGCRFCQAGFVCRPLRERPAELLNDIALESYKHTGYDEISLISLSVSDYSELSNLATRLKCWTDELNVNLSLPSMRIDAFSQELLAQTSSVRKSGLTFAPEAGSQRMRDVINKNLSEQEILENVKLAFDAGRSNVKLYFMIGLPGETDEDIIAIAELAKTIVGLYHKRENKEKNTHGVSVTISVASFVPKSHTPFCFEGQNSYEELLRKQQLLRGEINSRKIKYSYHNARISKLEAVFARGDRRLAKVLLEAFKLGVCFDGWDERFDYDLWLQAFANCSINPEDYAQREYAYGDILPWDFIDIGVSREFLVRENKRAKSASTTLNCREACANCGISDCTARTTPPTAPLPTIAHLVTQNVGDTMQKTFRIKFEKADVAKYISHLDLNRLFARALSRAGLKIAHSEGFNPHPKIVFASTLSLGTESFCEAVDVKILGDITAEEISAKLKGTFPTGINILDIRELDPNSPTHRKFKEIDNARFFIFVKSSNFTMSDLEKLFSDDVHVPKKPGAMINLRDYICKIDFTEESDSIKIDCILKTNQQQYLNPQIITKAIDTHFMTFADYTIQKVQMYDKNGEVFG